MCLTYMYEFCTNIFNVILKTKRSCPFNSIMFFSLTGDRDMKHVNLSVSLDMG